MPWTKILLSDDQVKDGEIKPFLSKFRDMFHEAGMPTDMALFSGQPTDTGYHPFYLTPACSKPAENLIAEYSGTTCDKPVKNGLEPTMEIGFNRGWDLLLD